MKTNHKIRYLVLLTIPLLWTGGKQVFSQSCEVKEVPFPYSTLHVEEPSADVAPVPSLSPSLSPASGTDTSSVPPKAGKPKSRMSEMPQVRIAQVSASGTQEEIQDFSEDDAEFIPTPSPLGTSSQRFRSGAGKNRGTDSWLTVQESSENPAPKPRSMFSPLMSGSNFQWETSSEDNAGVSGPALSGMDANQIYSAIDSGYPMTAGTAGMYGGQGMYPTILACLGENLTFSIGGAGFQTPLDYGSGGAGFSETLNWVSPSIVPVPISLQAGFRAVQSRQCGYEVPRTYHRENTRDQYFGTLGVFHRGTLLPVQIGAAYDFMEDRYDQTVKLQQLRSEFSYVSSYGFEFGFRGAFGMKNDAVTRNISHLRYDSQGDQWFADWYTVTQGIRPNSYCSLFLKKYYPNGAEGAFSAGATNYGDAVFRLDYTIPLNDCVSLQNSFTYVLPEQGRGRGGFLKESWNAMLQLTYQPRGGLLAGFCDPARPMFDVADNGTFLQSIR
ncbi:MAG: hypothetical protein LBQ54_02075 [Planctomycetaceae bacterium]|jgi:hypothetical protein|nr:hypothetical protein [Planctomycetaceae bacterium]